MSDRTSARLFSEIFRYLAEGKPDARAEKFAKKVYSIYESGDYDFAPYQMECDPELKKLGLPFFSEED